MKMYKKYFFRPIQHGLTTEFTPLNQPFTLSSWGTKNMRIFESSAKKRWGYNTVDKSLGTTVYHVILYQTTGGSRYTLYLTGTDLCSRESAGTWSYKTDTYVTGNITTISGATVTGSGTSWSGNVAAGDYFILNEDHASTSEPDTSWRAISVVDAGGTQLTLSSAYEKDVAAVSKPYKIRKPFDSLPSNERWNWAVVNDIFVFTNGSVNVQKWVGGDTYATNLETGLGQAIKARYCIEYANRLFIQDYGTSRNPLALGWSKEGDPTNWTDNTSGDLEMLDSAGYGMGLGKSGTSLVVFQEDLINFYNKTGISFAPIVRTGQRLGLGCSAPYGILEIRGSCAFIGKEDFYVLDGDFPQSIGEKIRDKFFSIVGRTERKKVFGWHIPELNEAIWVANTSEGKLAFAWDYKRDEWNIGEFSNDIMTIGMGAL